MNIYPSQNKKQSSLLECFWILCFVFSTVSFITISIDVKVMKAIIEGSAIQIGEIPPILLLGMGIFATLSYMLFFIIASYRKISKNNINLTAFIFFALWAIYLVF